MFSEKLKLWKQKNRGKIEPIPRKENVKLSEPDELRGVLAHGRAEDGPVFWAGHVDGLCQQETHGDVQKRRVFAQQVHSSQRVHRHT